MSQLFLKGMLAEKAKLANTLIAEISAGLPDELLWKYQEALQAGSTACHNIYADLRGSDTINPVDHSASGLVPPKKATTA